MTSTTRQSGSDLTPSARALLDHVHLYRITTNKTAHAACFPSKKPSAARTAINRLVRDGWLESHSLFRKSNERYYVLSAKAVQELYGERARATAAPGPQALTAAYGVLQFCCMSSVKRPRIHPREFSQSFPELDEGDRTGHYFLSSQESDGSFSLGLALVDFGTQSPERWAAKLRKHIHKRLDRCPRWHTVLELGMLQLAILTGTRARADELYSRLHPVWEELTDRDTGFEVIEVARLFDVFYETP